MYSIEASQSSYRSLNVPMRGDRYAHIAKSVGVDPHRPERRLIALTAREANVNFISVDLYNITASGDCLLVGRRHAQRRSSPKRVIPNGGIAKELITEEYIPQGDILDKASQLRMARGNYPERGYAMAYERLSMRNLPCK